MRIGSFEIMEINKLYNGDCLECMKKIDDKSIDCIITDLPYGTTQCKWDVVVPFEPMWEHYNRIIKDNGAIILFGNEPFTSELIHSNIKNFKYNWIWQKDKATGHLNAKKQPMRITELISVFYKKQCYYNPQLTDKPQKNIRPATIRRKNIENYGRMDKESKRTIPIDKSYPCNILKFRGCFGDKGKSHHPTEKPVALIEYLINTYTKTGELVLDSCAGSMTTAIAAINTGRSYICMEKDLRIFQLGEERVKEHLITLADDRVKV